MKWSGPKDILCLECEALMRAFRHQGFDYMFDEMKQMCALGMSFYNKDGCIDMLVTYKVNRSILFASTTNKHLIRMNLNHMTHYWSTIHVYILYIELDYHRVL